MSVSDRSEPAPGRVSPRWATRPILQVLLQGFLVGVSGTAVLAQSATPGAGVELAPIVVDRPQAAATARPVVRRTTATRAVSARRRNIRDHSASRDARPIAPAQPVPSASAPLPGADPVLLARQRLEAMPGGTAVVSQSQIQDEGNPTISKALRSVPGVIVQDFFGGNDQPRIQIRGSGLQQNPVERGIMVLQNGLPINRADGSYVVGLANPNQTEALEVYRGYIANRLGATVLGGALNFVSPTGSSAPGARFTLSGGSYGQLNAGLQAGFRQDNIDGLIQVDRSQRDGYRAYNSSERTSVAANVGVAWADNIKTRFFIGYTDLGFDVAGPLTRDLLSANPRQVFTGPTVTPSGAINPGPNVVRDRPRRETSQFLIGQRTSATFGAHLVDFALGYTYTDDMFRFPISSGVRTTRGGDFTTLLRYGYKPDETSLLPLFESSAQYTIGSARRGNYLNLGGVQGSQFGSNDLDASTLSLYSGLNIPIWPAVTLSPSISYAYATRDNRDTFGLATRPTAAFSPARPYTLLPNGAVPTQDTSYGRTYQGWSPSLALSYRPVPDQTIFAAVSGGFEPPTHDDLLATVNGTPNSSAGRPNPAAPFAPADAFRTPNLKAQTATTVEGGWRGRQDNLSWDVVSYYSWIDNELLSLRDAAGSSLGAINAGRTTHFGIEGGIGAKLTDWLSARATYTYQDFRFQNDPIRGNNRLAGAPRHVVGAMLQLQPTAEWKIVGALRWQPEKTPVDNMNTVYAKPFAVVDLKTEYRINEHFTVFGEVGNIFNERYAASTLIVDVARRDQAVYLPGDGRTFYAGVRATY
ncbi:TonB-dependent receptor family protein [Enterovirga rhinocerotis]|uniref:Iron complex outermembrane receptor protein n=1 Tax=Enterovirga rhinocerotis TaxID=1339210 RepID=A0A4R7BJ33_9HYPH|nr:TonB-dependent receptor [Enterovirga rhinocerotis]TDR85360.1 iron complex outermembrane receptor protein [Enterovirga rhinocerotis]